jgi:DNA primase
MSATFIDYAAVKAAASIHQVAISMLKLTLTQKGDQYRGQCPIHKGGNRGFVITATKNLWHCFDGCGGGDQIELVSRLRGNPSRDQKGQRDAAHEIARFFGTVHDAPAGTSHDSTARATPPRTPAAAPAPTAFDPVAYAARLDVEHETLASLGISPETYRHFKCGYASSGLNRGRLALPMHDTQGTILGFCGRALDGKEPLLIFPKNFVPTSIAFNCHQVAQVDFVHVCSDPVEVLRAHEHGIENCIAALGSLNSEFLQVLSLWMEEKGIAAIEPM